MERMLLISVAKSSPPLPSKAGVALAELGKDTSMKLLIENPSLSYVSYEILNLRYYMHTNLQKSPVCPRLVFQRTVCQSPVSRRLTHL